MTAGFSSSSADQEVHRAISPPRWEQPRAQVRSTLCERDLAPCLAVPSTLPLPQAAALQTQTRLPVGARWTCRQASNILGMYTGSSAPLIPKKRLEKPISIIMSSSFLTAHQSQASSTVYSCMFHPKTGKPFTCKISFSLPKRTISGFRGCCTRAEPKAARKSSSVLQPRLQCVELHEGAASPFTWAPHVLRNG